MEFSWGDVFRFAATAGVITTVLNQGVGWWRESRKERRQQTAVAVYMALRIAIALETYASLCQTFNEGNKNAYHPPDQEFPNWDTHLPDLPAYPDDAEGWRALDSRLAARALNFPNRIAASRKIVSSTIEYVEHELDDCLEEQASERGLEAWRLAQALRAKYGIEKADVVWDFADDLENSLKRIARERAGKKAKRDSFGKKVAAYLKERGGF